MFRLTRLNLRLLTSKVLSLGSQQLSTLSPCTNLQSNGRGDGLLGITGTGGDIQFDIGEQANLQREKGEIKSSLRPNRTHSGERRAGYI